jgi:hypothetical protein
MTRRWKVSCSRLALVLLVAVAGLLPLVAQAEPPERRVSSPNRPQPQLLQRLSLGAEFGVVHLSETHSSETVVAPVLQGRVDITPDVALEVEGSFALERDSEGATSARSGNPWIKGWYRNATDRLRWQVGAGLSAPVATVNIGPGGRIQRALYNLSAAAWGLWDDWRWTPDRMAVPVLGGLSYQQTPRWALTGEVGLAPVIGARSAEAGTDLLVQGAIGARVLLGHRLSIAPRLQGVLLPSTSVDRLQTAAGLRLEWAPEEHRFFLGALVNLDEPLGVIGRGTQSWGIHLGKELGP